MADGAVAPPQSPAAGLTPMSAAELGGMDGTLATTGDISGGGMVLSETQLGNMALRSKNQRLKAEQDRQLLQNRINRLLHEQEKAQKRIAETRRRTDEILTLKERSKSQAEARQAAQSWITAEHENQKTRLSENRAQRTKAIHNAKASMVQLRQDEVKVLKQMSRETEEAVVQHREMERQRAAERRAFVRESHKAAAERKQIEQDAMRTRIAVNREQKRQELDADAMRHLGAYSSLAEEEARLLESLSKWNELQSDAQSHLENTLGASSSRPSSRQTTGRMPKPPPAATPVPGAPPDFEAGES